MGIGAGSFLIAVGAVLTFAVNQRFSGVNIQSVGIILMLVGALSVIVDLLVFAPRRRAVVTSAPATTTRTVVEERDARY